MWPFDDIGDAVGGAVKKMIASAFDAAMQAVWDASLAVLRGAFTLADRFSVFTVSKTSGPVSILWPMMLWISGVMALGLFFWQLVVTNLRGGRGFMRLVAGPFQYGIALAATVGMVAAFLVSVDALTDGILDYGLQSRNFSDALHHTSFGDGVVDGVKAIVLGICAFVGVIPAAIGYILELLFREAAIYVLTGSVPIVAAGLLANITSNWFWRTCRWLLACIAMKPVLAFAVVLGVAIAGGSEGLNGLLAGVGVLIISLFCPFVLFRMFAFVDPNSDSGAAFRDALSGYTGVESYGPNNPAMMAFSAAADAVKGGGAMEDANTARFDNSTGGGGSKGSPGDESGSSGEDAGAETSSDNDDVLDGEVLSVDYDDDAPPPGPGEGGGAPGASDDGPDDDTDPPEPPGPPGGSGPPTPPGGDGGPASGGGGSGGAAAEAAEAAVVV